MRFSPTKLLRLDQPVTKFKVLMMGLALTCIVVITASIFIYQISFHTQDGFARERRGRAFIAHSDRILGLLQEAESSHRGFLLTGQEVYLLPYQAATNAIPGELARLMEATTNHPRQQGYLKAFEKGLSGKLLEMDRVLAQYKSGGLDPALRQMETDEGRHLMTQIRALTHAIQRVEEQAVAEIEAETSRLVRLLEILAIAAVLSNLIGLGLGLYRLVGRMQELEDLITVCAWTKRVKYQGEWVDFDVYLKKHFGLKLTHGLSEEVSQLMRMEIKDRDDLGKT